MLEHKNSNTPYSYGMMLGTTAATSLPFFYCEMSSEEDSDDVIKHLLKLNPSKLQKIPKYASVKYNCTLISGEFCIITSGRIHPC